MTVKQEEDINMRLSSDWKNQSIIANTLRLEDLLPACEEFLGTYTHIPTLQYRATIQNLQETGQWGSDEAWLLAEELEDKFNEIAPVGCYFGAHPGNGSDIGFWEILDNRWEELKELITRYGITSDELREVADAMDNPAISYYRGVNWNDIRKANDLCCGE